MRFTDRSIKTLKPEDKRRDILEGKSRPGFAVRMFPSGNKSFIYIYILNGVKRRMTLEKHQVQTVRWRLHHIAARITRHARAWPLNVPNRYIALFRDIRLRCYMAA